MRALKLSCHWSIGRQDPIDPRLFDLLDGIRSTRSLAGAARATGTSYRHAWELLRRCSAKLAAPLADLTRGSGSRLTPFGEKLLLAERSARERIAPQLRSLSDEVNQELDRVRGGPARPLLAVASHDLALGELRDRMNASGQPALDVRFAGSLDALAALARGECDLAGFHVPRLACDAILAKYAELLHAHRWRFVHFVTRGQGLIVARGNPKQITGLASLADSDVRFINRQPGSGTRLLFDALLTASGLRPAGITGYAVEEFTHAAVAATVASGAADAGFGIEAAAHRLGQDFVPVLEEDYYLALRRGSAKVAGIDALLRVLRGPRFRAAVSSLRGYGATHSGEPVTAANILRALR